MTLRERFKAASAREWRDLDFSLVTGDQRKHERRDICAFLLLDELVGGNGHIVAAAEHDQIWLDADLKKLSECITDEQVLTLVRCGVFYDDDVDSLSMFA